MDTEVILNVMGLVFIAGILFSFWRLLRCMNEWRFVHQYATRSYTSIS